MMTRNLEEFYNILIYMRSRQHKKQQLRKMEYHTIFSNKQIRKYVHWCEKNQAVEEYMRLLYLIIGVCRLFSQRERVLQLLDKKYDDDEFYDRLHRLWKEHTSYGQSRSPSAGQMVKDHLATLGFSPQRYLDFGVGNGKKTEDIASHLGLTDYRGTDITEWFGYKKDRRFPFEFLPMQDGRIPLEDSCRDLITCIHVLHHVKDLAGVLRELFRVLEHGGLLLIVEHDFRNSGDYMLGDIEHALYERVFRKNHRFVHEYYGAYFSEQSLDRTMEKHGFRKVPHARQPMSSHHDPTNSIILTYRADKNPSKKRKMSDEDYSAGTSLLN